VLGRPEGHQLRGRVTISEDIRDHRPSVSHWARS
jgi:hypothetical protein